MAGISKTFRCILSLLNTPSLSRGRRGWLAAPLVCLGAVPSPSACVAPGDRGSRRAGSTSQQGEGPSRLLSRLLLLHAEGQSEKCNGIIFQRTQNVRASQSPGGWGGVGGMWSPGSDVMRDQCPV